MKAIKYKNGFVKPTIQIGRIDDFVNKCKVTEEKELCNVELEYIPYEHVVELGSYRAYFKDGFNLLIEDLCQKVFDDFFKKIKPAYLKVTVFLLPNKTQGLTPWSVTLCTKSKSDSKYPRVIL